LPAAGLSSRTLFVRCAGSEGNEGTVGTEAIVNRAKETWSWKDTIGPLGDLNVLP
jgi:hypothetical protein